MKFFHLSDLHIGIKLLNQDLREEQKEILEQIIQKAKEYEPDAVVIAGDVYDKSVPSVEAVQLFDEFIQKLTSVLADITIMIISGNHDSSTRVDYLRKILLKQKIYMIGRPPQKPEEYIEKVTMRDCYGNVNFYLLPFVKPSVIKEIVGTDEKGNQLTYNAALHKLMERETLDLQERNVLVSHQFYLPHGKKAEEMERMDSEICIVGNIDEVSADLLEDFDYAALGHIHKPMTVGKEVYRYCGTPLACSVSEQGQQKGIVLVDMKEKGKVEISTIPLIPKHQVRVIKDEFRKVLEQSCEDYVTVILTDKTDLDVFDLYDKLRAAFPNLLEIRRESVQKNDYSISHAEMKQMNSFELCCSFLKELDEEEKKILQDVIQEVQGGQ